MSTEKKLEKIAFDDLKAQIVNLMYEFTDKYNEVYSKHAFILIDVLTSCLEEAQYYVKDYNPFTTKQLDHICYQIGDWYFMMKPLLEGTHNLGYMKEKLKMMICQYEENYNEK